MNPVHSEQSCKSCLNAFSVFVAPVFSPAVQGTRHHKAGKKQVAMIAQKVIDANQTHR